MNISYEVNDFTLLTASYRSLLDSCHSLQINAAIYFLIIQTLSLSDLSIFFRYNSNLTGKERVYYIGIYLKVTVLVLGTGLLSEYFLCGQNKFCSLFTFFLFDLLRTIVYFLLTFNNNVNTHTMNTKKSFGLFLFTRLPAGHSPFG